MLSLVCFADMITAGLAVRTFTETDIQYFLILLLELFAKQLLSIINALCANKLATVWCCSIYKPSPTEKQDICHAIITTFPILKDGSPTGYVSLFSRYFFVRSVLCESYCMVA